MQTNFIQPGGSTSIQSSGEVLSQLLNIPQASIGSIELGADLTNISFALDPATKEIYNVNGVQGSVTGLVVSGTTAVVSTEKGSFSVNAFPSVLTTISIPTIADLRKFEPWYAGQKVLLERAVQNGPLVNELITYDPASSKSDNDYSVFKTTKGATWLLDTSKPINVWMAGFSVSANNLAQCINKITTDIVKIVIARGYIANGTYRLRVPPLDNATGETVYKMTATVRIPPFVSIVVDTNQTWDFSAFTTGNGVEITGEFTGLTRSAGNPFTNNAGSSASYTEVLDTNALFILGPGYDKTTFHGISLGNTIYPSGGFVHTREVKITGVKVAQFYGGIRIGSTDTYLDVVENCDFYRNAYGVVTDAGTNCVNSGENMRFVNCLIGDNYLGGVYRNDTVHMFKYFGCSFDYNTNDVVFYSPVNIGQDTLIECHVEGFRYLANCPSRTTGAGENNFKMIGGNIFMYAFVNDPYRGVRTIGYATTTRTAIDLDNVNIFCYGPHVNSAYGSYKAYDPTNLIKVRIRYPLRGQTYRFLPSYDTTDGYILNSTGLLFNGTAGAALPTARAIGQWYVVANGSTIVYGSAADADSDGLIPVTITATSTTNSVNLLWGTPINNSNSQQKFHVSCSVKAGAATTGNVYVRGVCRLVSSQSFTNNSTTNVVSMSENYSGYALGPQQDILNSLTKTGITLTADNYMGTYMLSCDTGTSQYGYAGLNFTGFVGTIQVKLPAVWFSDQHPTLGYL